jgi:hypothetical protein
MDLRESASTRERGADAGGLAQVDALIEASYIEI